MSVHDRWSGARTGTGRRWEVRWRDAGQQRKRRFETRGSAEAFEAKRRLEPEVRLAAEGRALTVERLMVTWLATKGALKVKTLDAYKTDKAEILHTFSGRLASTLTPSEVRVWVGRDRGVWMRRRSLIALGQAYRIAIADGLLATTPCLGIRTPVPPMSPRRSLTWEELTRLAEAAGQHGPLIWLLGTAGLRLGEAIGLQVGDVNLVKGRIRISRSVVTTSQGRVIGPPKNGKWRDVGVARFVLNQLPVAGRPRDAWLFTGVQGGILHGPMWRRRVFQPAAERAELAPLTPHELRHTAVSLAIESGADVLAVQRMVGHASPDITLRVYSHAWDSGMDRVAEAMEGRHQSA